MSIRIIAALITILSASVCEARSINGTGDPYVASVTSADCGGVILVDSVGNVVLQVDSAASLGSNCSIDIKKRTTGSGLVTIVSSVGELIDGTTTILLSFTKDSVRLYSDGQTIEALTPWRRSPIESHRTVTCDLGDHTLRTGYNLLPKDIGAMIRVDTNAISQWNLPSCDLGIYLNPAAQYVGPAYRGAVLVITRVDNTAKNVTLFAWAGETINGQSSITIAGQWTWITLYSDGQQWFAVKSGPP